MNNLGAQAEHLFYPVLAPALVPGIHPQLRKARKAISYTLEQQFDPVLIWDLGFLNESLRIHQEEELALPAANLLPTPSYPRASPSTPGVLADCESTTPALSCGFLLSLVRKRSRRALS
jgi:hypothetical protein